MSRILPFLFLAGALGAREAPPSLPIKALRLKVEASPGNPALALDPKEVTADLEGFLTGQGFQSHPKVKVKVQPPAPPYPTLALEQKVEGTVTVLLTLDPDGRPVRAIAAGGPPELKATALRYAMQWIFEPVKVGGKPVWARFRLPMPFKLGT